MLLTVGLKEPSLGEKILVGELELVLEPDPVPCLLVSHSRLQNHEFKHLMGSQVRSFAQGDEGSGMG